jgi:ribosomal protein S18 acetylase RimI-like enzyme
MTPSSDLITATIATDILRERPAVPSASRTFPRVLSLAHGVTVNVRLAGPGDEQGLLDFYRALPLDDRLFLKDDVTTEAWATRFMRRIACGEVRSLIAERDGRVVAEATLARATHGWSVHVAELRVAVARIVRHQGLASALADLLVEMAIDDGADKLIVQVVEHQVAALQVFRKLGFQPEAVLRRHVKDASGTRRDLWVLASDLSQAWVAMEALIADIPPEAHP